jgi:hypothetical protein
MSVDIVDSFENRSISICTISRLFDFTAADQYALQAGSAIIFRSVGR